VRDDDVDLLVEDAVLVGHCDGYEEDSEDVVTVRLQRRAWLVRMLGRREQESESRLLHRLRKLLPKLFFGRIDQVDPLGHSRRG